MLKNLIWGAHNYGTLRVDDYPSQPPTLYTVAIHTQNFIGTIAIMGSIYENPTDDQWYTIRTETYLQPQQGQNRFVNRYFNCKGRIINMKAVVTPTDRNMGRVDRVVVNT